MPSLRVAFISSEVAPWSKTGGLGDVGGALPVALSEHPDLELCVFTPLYRSAKEIVERRGCRLDPVGPSFGLQGGTARFLRLSGGGGHAPTVFLDAPHLFDRAGIYGPASSQAYTDTGKGSFDDNYRRFAGFCEAVVDHAESILGGPADVLHCHDWQAALVPGLVAQRPGRPATVLTIHNLAYQGAFPLEVLAGKAPAPGYGDGGHLNLLGGAIRAADRVTTVSPHYAQEITTPEFGCGLDRMLQDRGVTGILNGIDVSAWDPSTDGALSTAFSVDGLGKRAANRSALLEEFGLPDEPGTVLLAMISRLTAQKGPELVAELVPRLSSLKARLVVLGTGDKTTEARFASLADRYPHRFGARLDFDVKLARRIYGSADAILVPSRFEPCGLVQMYAMRYGALPIASPVGGLVDTVTDPGDEALARGEGRGFLMNAVSPLALAQAVDRAARLYRTHPKAWQAIQGTGMRHDWSWSASASAWVALYREVSATA